MISSVDKLHCERQAHNDERRLAIGFHNQRIAAIEPAIQLAEGIELRRAKTPAALSWFLAMICHGLATYQRAISPPFSHTP
jgi:hypothetical protein